MFQAVEVGEGERISGQFDGPQISSEAGMTNCRTMVGLEARMGIATAPESRREIVETSPKTTLSTEPRMQVTKAAV